MKKNDSSNIHNLLFGGQDQQVKQVNTLKQRQGSGIRTFHKPSECLSPPFQTFDLKQINKKDVEPGFFVQNDQNEIEIKQNINDIESRIIHKMKEIEEIVNFKKDTIQKSPLLKAGIDQMQSQTKKEEESIDLIKEKKRQEAAQKFLQNKTNKVQLKPVQSTNSEQKSTSLHKFENTPTQLQKRILDKQNQESKPKLKKQSSSNLPQKLTIRDSSGQVVENNFEKNDQQIKSRRPPLNLQNKKILNSDLKDISQIDSYENKDIEENKQLKNEINELNEQIQILKDKVQEKTIEVNKLKKKLQNQQKQNEDNIKIEPVDEEALFQTFQNKILNPQNSGNPLKLDERRIIALKLQYECLQTKFSKQKKIIENQRKSIQHCLSCISQIKDNLQDQNIDKKICFEKILSVQKQLQSAISQESNNFNKSQLQIDSPENQVDEQNLKVEKLNQLEQQVRQIYDCAEQIRNYKDGLSIKEWILQLKIQKYAVDCIQSILQIFPHFLKSEKDEKASNIYQENMESSQIMKIDQNYENELDELEKVFEQIQESQKNKNVMKKCFDQIKQQIQIIKKILQNKNTLINQMRAQIQIHVIDQNNLQ